MPDFSAQHALFRAYDIRGARQHFSAPFVQALGYAFARLYLSAKKDPNPVVQPKNQSNTDSIRVVMGYDVRCNSDTIARELSSILQAQGLQVIRLGLMTTPMMAFWAQHYDGHGIMVTASHSAKETLGVKWLVGNTSPSSEDIAQLRQNLTMGNATIDTRRTINTDVNSNDNIHNTAPLFPIQFLTAKTVSDSYIDTIQNVFNIIYNYEQRTTTLEMTIVIDCMHGATSMIAQRLFSQFCRHVIMLNDTPDGNFPLGNPDPTEPNRLAELQQTVIVEQADMGLAFDGDGDRLMIVDNSGKVVSPDHLLYLLAQVALADRPQQPAITRTALLSTQAPQVIFDIKCSHHLPKLLAALGATPVMSKTGSSFLRQQLQTADNLAIFAGELSGHFIFNDGYFIVYDDAMYAGLRLLHWLQYTAQPPPLDKGYESSGSSMIITKTPRTDIWGEQQPITARCKLTDITQHFPVMVSTSDHYLPLPESYPTLSNLPDNYSIVTHLADFCHYLQYIISEDEGNARDCYNNSNKAANIKNDNQKPTTLAWHYPQFGTPYTASEALQLLPSDTRLSCIDGVRLDFTHGFGVLRQSNTSHSLTVRFAGDSKADMEAVQARFVALCAILNEPLAAQIAALCPHY